MSNARTIEWASVAEWVAENEQQIRDVMKFEGLKGAMVEVLRLAPEQSELAALREELAEIKESTAYRGSLLGRTEQRLTAVEQRNAELVELANSVLESFASYERVGEVCSFEAMPMIHASTLIELAGIAESALKPTESGASE